MNRKPKRNSQAGVTLIEMLVVVTIIALFAAVVAPKLLNKTDAARKTAARVQINAFMTALGAYKIDTGLYPTNELGLRALRDKPQGVNNWQGPYLPQEIPVDPWGRAFIYKYPGEHGDDPDVISYGADGTAGGEGNNADIVSWKSQ
ncbi:MAG: type II secretion system major pseudopilin GspG [Bryobacterales bacterium]|nr:type II secretion system major pseudopilin GspG [Bryobacterales bacterium]